MNKLKSYLNSEENSRVREVIFKYSFVHDIKLSGCLFNEHLKIYEQEVDNEGCDIIIEDGKEFYRKIQLKSIYESTTNSWYIHKSMLRPAFSQMEDYGFDTIFCPLFPGGVVLIEAKTKNEKKDSLIYDYYYSDINIITLISLGIIKRQKATQDLSNKILRSLRVNEKNIKDVKLRKSLFVKAQDSLALIKLMGLCGYHNWIDSCRHYIRNILHPSRFFITLPDYNPYETSEAIRLKWNEELESSTKANLKVIETNFNLFI